MFFFFFCIGLFASADWDGVLLWDFCLGKFNDDTIRALILGHPHTKTGVFFEIDERAVQPLHVLHKLA